MLAGARICRKQNCETSPKEGFVLRDKTSKKQPPNKTLLQCKTCTCLNYVSKWPVYRFFKSFSTCLGFFIASFQCIIFKLSSLNPRNTLFHFLEQLNKLIIIIIVVVVIHQRSEIFSDFMQVYILKCVTSKMWNDPLWYLYNTNTWHLQHFLQLKH